MHKWSPHPVPRPVSNRSSMQFNFTEKVEMLEFANEGATFLLNSPYNKKEVWDKLPGQVQRILIENKIKVISNKGWSHKGDNLDKIVIGGEQPIDVSYTILALKKFYDVFQDEQYKQKMNMAFDWFLGNNHLKQIIYNPCTGGCYDGLEENYVNLNQGAESTVSYLMARLTVENFFRSEQKNEVKRKFISAFEAISVN